MANFVKRAARDRAYDGMPRRAFFFGADVARKKHDFVMQTFFAKKSLILYLAVVTSFSKGGFRTIEGYVVFSSNEGCELCLQVHESNVNITLGPTK